jgi:glutathione S-transferase
MPGTASSPIVFYDIIARSPVEKHCFSPNPWKARLALNFKHLEYSTTWVALPDIAQVRRSLNVPPCRKFADGTDFYTLPIIEDPATESLVGDSFDIAVYLQKTYPDSGDGDLFPPQELDYIPSYDHPMLVPLTECRDSGFPHYAKFNVNIDAAFTAHVQLMVLDMPFDIATAEDSKQLFIKRAGVTSWEDFALVGEARHKLFSSFRDMLGGLAKLYLRDPRGPYILGSRPTYADFIVGGWLQMISRTLPQGEWDEVASWHGGVFGRLNNALEKYATVV